MAPRTQSFKAPLSGLVLAFGLAFSLSSVQTALADPPNTPPVAVSDEFSVSEGAVTIYGGNGILTNDYDPDGDPIYVSGHSGLTPDFGVLNVESDGSLTYTPDPCFIGDVSFVYNVSDGEFPLSNFAQVVIHVKPGSVVQPTPGDCNADGDITPLDLSEMIDILFFNGRDARIGSHTTWACSDFNSDGTPDAVDLNALIANLYFDGAAPIAPCAK